MSPVGKDCVLKTKFFEVDWLLDKYGVDDSNHAFSAVAIADFTKYHADAKTFRAGSDQNWSSISL